jgi:hypothetical protein
MKQDKDTVTNAKADLHMGMINNKKYFSGGA